ncbi:cell cycle control protein [Histomonas meleagridis]|uniref:cell cycle control protein n=1 Tax=Histomonas meleagridis TaxID=135588 RepID=UPI00355ACD62|nr:cell cycle control protein [Histomonas meleagridis]KAH0800821.1 cell cycle control protein [Histomonas meleagridis]
MIQEEEANQPQTFRQKFEEQTLPSWRPILTPKRAVILFFVLGVILFIIGIIYYLEHKKIHYVDVRYDDICPVTKLICTVPINIDSDMKGDLHLQYKLTKFHQNHRRFSYSKVSSQLAGDYVSYQDMESCAPYRSINGSTNESDFILPCGMYALSVFNDTFVFTNDSTFFKEDIITLQAEKLLFKPLSEGYVTGLKWLEDNQLFPGNQTDPHFIVWMRTSSFSNVVKDYGICKDCELKEGKYEIQIQSNYPTESFGGEKHIIITESSVLQQSVLFLPLVFMVSGAFLVFLAAFFLVLIMLNLRSYAVLR